MPESEPISGRPLLKHGYLEIPEPGNYKDLLVVECDPNMILYIRDIVIATDEVTAMATPKPYINIFLNGKPYVKDANFFYGYAGFGFGGHLKMWNVKKPIIIQIKTTEAGALYATAYVTGIEVPK
jgi:hypothetical protein